MSKPLLSIITATYNSEKTLERTLKSVLNQNFTAFEYIIVDGASKDNTLAIIKQYELLFKEKNITYKWISEPDTGIYNAWNKGLKLVEGTWVSFLGSDDIYLDNALKKFAQAAKENPKVDFIHAKVKLVDGDKVVYKITQKWTWKKFKKEMKIAHVGAFHNANFFNKYGVYDESFKITGDYELLLRAKEKLKTIYIPEYTAYMEVGGVSNDMVFESFKEARNAKIKNKAVSKIKGFLDFYFIAVKYLLSQLIKK